MLAEGSLQGGQGLLARETLNRHHRAPFGLNREHEARLHRFAIDNDCARAAHPMFAAEMGPGQPQLVAQAIGEVHARLDLGRDGLAVELERHSHHAPCAWAAPRKPRSTSVATRARR
jgi:hypothetical protein